MTHPLAVQDSLRRIIQVEKPPERIVSLVPSLTETLFAFGLRDRIVGVTDYCTEPAGEVAQKTKVGGTKKPHRERILRLNPDLVIMNAEENRREDAEYLENHGLTLYVTFPKTVGEGIELMRTLAKLTGTLKAAEEILGPIEEAYREALSRVRRGPPVKVFCPIWKKPYMSFNSETYVDNFITLCGGQNLFKDRAERYFKVTLEEVVLGNPEVILLPDEPYKFSEADRVDFQNFPEISAVKTGRVHRIDGKLISWYGPRIQEGLRTLRRLF